MQYIINKKNVKQSIKNLSTFLIEKGFDIPQNIYLEGFARALSFKNWNTLNGMANQAQAIPHTTNKKIYILEIEINLDRQVVEKELLDSFKMAECEIKITDIISHLNNHHFEITFPKSNNNFITGAILFAKRMQPHKPTRFEWLRISVEKENLLGLLNI